MSRGPQQCGPRGFYQAMAKYVARRLGLMVVALRRGDPHLVPHRPRRPCRSDRVEPRAEASERPEIVQAFKEKWGLDKPLYVQYLTFLGNLTRGELGNSINTRRAITKDLKAFLPATIELSTVAVLFALAIGVPLGVVAAIRRESVIDHAARLLSLIGVSLPIFWLATVSLVIFYATLHWTVGPSRLGPQIDSPPFVTGFFTVDSLIAGDYRTFRDAVAHLILPGLVLASSVMGLVTRVTRASMLDVLSQDYVRTARAKGLRERVTIGRHALRNALIPTVTVLGLAYGGLLSGAVMTETIFAWPGLGRYAFQSAVTNDFPGDHGRDVRDRAHVHDGELRRRPPLRLARPADPVLVDGDGIGDARGGGRGRELATPVAMALSRSEGRRVFLQLVRKPMVVLGGARHPRLGGGVGDGAAALLVRPRPR